MKSATISLLCICVAVGAPYFFADEHTKGYILKVGEGEFAAGAIIKASPKTGTNGAVLLYELFPENSSTGLHYHAEADEFFYVISGTGFARFGGKDHPIGMIWLLLAKSGR